MAVIAVHYKQMPLLLVEKCQFKKILESIQTKFVCCALKINNNNNIIPTTLTHSIAVIHSCLF